MTSDSTVSLCLSLSGFVGLTSVHRLLQGAAVHALWKENRKMLHIASKCKKPAADVLGELRKGVAAAGKPIADAKASRDCKAPNHAAGANDAASAFFWVNVEAGPLDIITSAREGCDFFLNKVSPRAPEPQGAARAGQRCRMGDAMRCSRVPRFRLSDPVLPLSSTRIRICLRPCPHAVQVRKQSKDENDPRHMAFANLIRDGLAALFDFVKANFKMGISWNPKGADAAAFAAGAGAAKFAAAAAAPAAAAAAAPAAAAAAAGGAGGADPAALQSALFKQLSSIDQSSGRTAGLRHVTKDMKSKPGDAPAVVPAAAAAAGGAGAAKAAPAAAAGRREDAVPTGAPRVALVDKRYYVEFQQERGAQVHVPAPGGAALTIAQEVYIYACKDVAVFIDSKCKGVSWSCGWRCGMLACSRLPLLRYRHTPSLCCLVCPCCPAASAAFARHVPSGSPFLLLPYSCRCAWTSATT